MTAEKKPRRKKSMDERIAFLDQQIAESEEWTGTLKARKHDLIERERKRANAILAALPTE